MDSLAELVYAAGFFQTVSVFQKRRKITGKAGGFAGNVDNMFHAVGEDLRQRFWMDAVTGGIEDDDVRLFGKVVENLQNISCNKAAVGQTVKSGVFSGCFYRILHNLHTNDLICNGSCKLGNGSGAAVEVKNNLVLRISNVISYNRVQ